jgi:hypothetical protein
MRPSYAAFWIALVAMALVGSVLALFWRMGLHH